MRPEVRRAFSRRRTRRWLVVLVPPILTLAAFGTALLWTSTENSSERLVTLRVQSVDIGLQSKEEAIAHTEQRLASEVWVPERLPWDLELQFVDSVLDDGTGVLPYSLMGYASGAGDATRTMTVSQFAGHVPFPVEKAIEIPMGVDGVKMWTPPSPFGIPGGSLNFQYIVRTDDRQLLFWFVATDPPPIEDVRRMVASTVRR